MKEKLRNSSTICNSCDFDQIKGFIIPCESHREDFICQACNINSGGSCKNPNCKWYSSPLPCTWRDYHEGCHCEKCIRLRHPKDLQSTEKIQKLATDICSNCKHPDKRAWKNNLCDNCQWRAKTITCDCGFNLCNRKESPHKECRINL